LAEAHGLTGMVCRSRGDVESVIRKAESTRGTVVVDFRVEQEDTVYPMVPTGNDLQNMIRRPQSENPLVETAGDPM
ncbi:MAG: acetolactate synthase large subunit, partial [Spirochaetota bacterium]